MGPEEEMPRDQAAFNDYVAKEIRSMKIELKSNSDLTEEIRDVVELFRGLGLFIRRWGNRFRSTVIWLTPIAVAAYGIWKFIAEYTANKVIK